MPEAMAARVLVLVSADFGELASAMYLLEGTETCVRLLLPSRLQEKNPLLPPHTVAAYSSATEVIVQIQRWRPECLLLMSAYLFEVNGLLNMQDLQQILREARALGVDVATTDPFLRLLPSLSDKLFSSAQVAAWEKNLSALREILLGVPHVYLSPMPKEPSVRSFFNPRAVISPDERARSLASLQQGPLHLDVPYWLFVLSSVDYSLQCGLHGKAGFDDMLLGILRQGLGARHHALLLAPPEAAQALEGRLPEFASIVTFCDYRTFQALLLNAAHVFYWNALSNSVLLRIVNGGSVFFMDVGHLVRLIPSICPIAMQAYYANAQLSMLDPTQVIDLEYLSQQAQVQPEVFAPALAALHALPSPDELISSLSGVSAK